MITEMAKAFLGFNGGFCGNKLWPLCSESKVKVNTAWVILKQTPTKTDTSDF